MSGWFTSLIGTRIQSVAIGWEIYQRTGKALSLGLVGLIQALPNMLLALPAGYLADTFDRRKLVIFSLAGATVTSVSLAVLSYHQGNTGLMYLLLLFDATALALGRPARSALLPQLVPRQVFPNAVMWSSSTFHLSSAIGPAVGGFILAANVPSAYLISACGTLIFIGLLTKIDIRDLPERNGSKSITFKTLLAGLRFVWNAKLLLTTMLLDMFAVLLGGAIYLLPMFAKDILQVGEIGFGCLRAAPAIGAVVMAIMIAHLPPMKRAGRNLLLAVAGFGMVTVIFGVSKYFWLSFIMLFMTGVLDNVSVVIRHTLVQLLTPDQMRGRVSAVNGIFIGTSNELGGFESGLVASWFGAIASVVIGGIGTILVVVTTALAAPELRRLQSLRDIKTLEEEQTDNS
ncbi:TPA: MFS transporter [Candidatus Poribacteria bacterium]|jgi:MFS family permease|nr:MFS transporter [Candidatus Poribacteria bacterium]HIB89215.1 MFS transporter [Candidatus Poribacteria bacterium]HIC00116.1 MFS transporter [Candidatus Poribacteria bacterium]HIC19680.1 MFS transporter [Candidatus Poribacteria bacterium]HIM10615.1 MFS transporter [Candidatus Poribacteria bacterium]